jgi:predicted PurR-regulated permease PerM
MALVAGRQVDTSVEAAPVEAVPVVETAAAAEAGSEAGRSVPGWAVIGIFLLMAVAAMALARDFLMPVVLAFLLALVFSPVRRFLGRRGVPDALSALVLVGSLLALLISGMLLLATPVQGWIADAPNIARELEWKARALFTQASAMLEVGQQVEEAASGSADETVQEVVLREPGLVSNLAWVAPIYLAQTVFTLVLLLFLLASGDMFYEKIVNVMPTFGDRRQAMRIAYDIERKLSRYLFTITLINASLGLAVGTAMWLVGMPNPLLFGVIAFALNFVPYLGAVAGIAIAFVVGLLTLPDPAAALLPALVYLGLTTIEGQLVTPYFVGRRLEMNTVVIFLSITFWAWLWSVMGMLLAVPLLVTIRAFCEHIPTLAPVGKFLAARGGENDTIKGNRGNVAAQRHGRTGCRWILAASARW